MDTIGTIPVVHGSKTKHTFVDLDPSPNTTVMRDCCFHLVCRGHVSQSVDYKVGLAALSIRIGFAWHYLL